MDDDAPALFAALLAQPRACAGMDVERFFPLDSNTLRIDAAKQVCAPCTARPACLAAALSFDAHGVWGGTSRTDRQLMQHRRPVADRAG